jgi:hypothetical protein
MNGGQDNKDMSKRLMNNLLIVINLIIIIMIKALTSGLVIKTIQHSLERPSHNNWKYLSSQIFKKYF